MHDRSENKNYFLIVINCLWSHSVFSVFLRVDDEHSWHVNPCNQADLALKATGDYFESVCIQNLVSKSFSCSSFLSFPICAQHSIILKQIPSVMSPLKLIRMVSCDLGSSWNSLYKELNWNAPAACVCMLEFCSKATDGVQMKTIQRGFDW